MNRDNDLLWAFLLGAFAFGLGFLWPILVFAKAEDGFSQGTLVAHDPVTCSRSELPRLSTNVEINVTGPIARARVTQHFANPRDQWTEALYAFPLPENAAVDHFRNPFSYCHSKIAKLSTPTPKDKNQHEQLNDRTLTNKDFLGLSPYFTIL